MLRTKCIFDPIYEEDGVRISVMSRHTQTDGKTPDWRIVEGRTYDIHWTALAPPATLVGWWYREKIRPTMEIEERWKRFTANYLEHLDKPVQRRSLAVFTGLIPEKINATILCYEPLEEINHCHRSILAEQVRLLRPDIEIRHV